MNIVSLILLLVVWVSLGVTIGLQGYEIHSLRYSLAIVSGVERGMFRSQMIEHKALQACILLQLSTKPLSESCY